MNDGDGDGDEEVDFKRGTGCRAKNRYEGGRGNVVALLVAALPQMPCSTSTTTTTTMKRLSTATSIGTTSKNSCQHRGYFKVTFCSTARLYPGARGRSSVVNVFQLHVLCLHLPTRKAHRFLLSFSRGDEIAMRWCPLLSQTHSASIPGDHFHGQHDPPIPALRESSIRVKKPMLFKQIKICVQYSEARVCR